MAISILITDAFGCPTTDGVDDFSWAFDGTEAIPQTMPEGVHNTSIPHSWLQPIIKRRTCLVRIALVCLWMISSTSAMDT